MTEHRVSEPSPARSWARHVVRRDERTRTTWTFRLLVLALIVLTGWLTRGWWSSAIAHSLVCESDTSPSEALLLENFDPDYLLFERARQLRKAGVADRILVPTAIDSDSGEPNDVALGTVELMARIARVDRLDIVPIPSIEPISLNAAYRIRDFLVRERIRSVTVVSPLFRSRRSTLVYHATLGPAGIAVRCVAVPDAQAVESRLQRWHGLQAVTEQWVKLQYYRLYVLPFANRRSASG